MKILAIDLFYFKYGTEDQLIFVKSGKKKIIIFASVGSISRFSGMDEKSSPFRFTILERDFSLFFFETRRDAPLFFAGNYILGLYNYFLEVLAIFEGGQNIEILIEILETPYL